MTNLTPSARGLVMRMRGRFTGAKRAGLCAGLILLAVFLLAFVGCGGRRGGPITLRVANSGTEAGGACPGPERTALPALWSCTRFAIRDNSGGFVTVFEPNMSVGVAGPVVVPFGPNNDFAFDLPEETRGANISVSVHGTDGLPVAVGEAEVGDLALPITVGLYPLGQASCLVPSTEAPLPRAFHRAVRFPNGDVLVFGGVKGVTVPFVGGGSPPGFLHEERVQSYRPGDNSWVTANTSSGAPSSYRSVMFSALLESQDLVGGKYVVRVTGGFGTAGPVLGVDTNQLNTASGAPIFPIASGIADAASDAFLRYDPVRRTVDVDVDVDPDADSENLRPWGSAVAGDPVDTKALALFELQSAGIAAPAQPTLLYARKAALLESGRSRNDAMITDRPRGRSGATMTRLPDRSGWLVFGGNYNNVGEAPLVAEAASVTGLDVTVPPLALTLMYMGAPANGRIPGFHTTAQVGGALVSVGGLVASCVCGTPPFFPISKVLLQDSVVSLQIAGATLDSVLVPAPVPLIPSILHGTTYLLTRDASGQLVPDPNRWLVTGGAGIDLVAVNQVRLIEASGGGVQMTNLAGIGELIQGRFGHTAVTLDAHHVLVFGGLVRWDNSTKCGQNVPVCFEAIAGAEVLPYGYDGIETVPSVSPAQCVRASDGGADGGVDGG